LKKNPDVRYAKTEKGQDEIKRRTAGLGPRLRSLLVMVDGTTTAGQLAFRLNGLGASVELIDTLVSGGFIRETGDPTMSEKGAGAAPLAGDIRPALANDSMKIGAAKAVLRRYAKLASGVFNERSLNKRVDAAHSGLDIEACLQAFVEYFHAHGNDGAAANVTAELRAATR
jgi:hypothetical protein